MTKASRLRDLKTGVRDTIYIDPRIIEIEPGHNPRNYDLLENRAHLDQLKASIKQHGVRSPLFVRFDNGKGAAILVDGECRLRASLELISEGVAIESVPTIQVQGKNEADRLEIALTANTGKPLSTWEAGTAFVKLIGYGWTPEMISERIGFSKRFVNEAIELADAPEEVKHLLSEQAVTPSLALAELRSKTMPEAVESLRSKVVTARAKGQKTARKEQDKPQVAIKNLMNVIAALVASCQDEIFDTEHKWCEVDKSLMRKLAGFVGIKESK